MSADVNRDAKMLEIPHVDLLFLSLIVALVTGLISVLLLMWYSIRKQDYFRKYGIPFVKSVPFVGSIIQNIRTPLHNLELKRYNELGHIYAHYEGNRPLLSVGDTKMIREILVKDFYAFPNRRVFKLDDDIMDKMLTALSGEDWKRVRTIITPTFTTGKIKRMLSIFKDCSDSVVANFKQTAKDGTPPESKQIYGAYTMDVIASSLFSTKIDSHNDPQNQFVAAARKVFSGNLNWKFVLFVMCPRLLKLFRVPLFDVAVITFFRDVITQIIEQRKRTGTTRNDFLQLLMDTAKESESELKEDADDKENDITSNYGEESAKLQSFKHITSKNLSMNELLAQCIIFFLAGYDTTASTLSFTSYLLALNPDVQDKLRDEVDEALKETDGQLTYEAIQSMKYLDNVISETLRLYPPVIRLERTAEVDYKLGETGIIIPKGVVITIPSYAMHRDPQHFPEPEKFDPDRFSSEERAKRDQYCYLPFGSGPRNCVGMRFALMEIKVCLAHVISTFKIKRHPQTKVPLEFYNGQGLLKPKEILLEYEQRKEGPMMK